MTRDDDELLVLMYALLKRLDAKDLITSRLISERILLVLSPLGPVSVTDVRIDALALAMRTPTFTKH